MNFDRLTGEDYLVDMLKPIEERRGDEMTLVKIYHRRSSLILSEVLPLLENLGFKVLEQVPYRLSLGEDVLGIDLFKVQCSEVRRSTFAPTGSGWSKLWSNCSEAWQSAIG